MTKEKRGIKFVFVGIVTNAFLAVIKITAGILGNSYALVADGIESTTDIFSSIIVLSGLKIAAKPPDQEHPYGHGKAEALAGMFVSLSLLAAAVLIIINSIHEIITPHHAPEPFTLLVLVVVIIAKEILFRTVFKVGNEIESTALRTDAWHHRSDAITSGAAFVGIAVALIMGPGYESADDYGALVASALIIFNAFRLLRHALSDVMDESPLEMKTIITSMVRSIPGVGSVQNVKIRKSGLHYLVDLDIQVHGDLSVYDSHDISEKVADMLKNSNLSVQDVMVHTEPFMDLGGIH